MPALPLKAVWSLTLYNQHHFFAPNEIGRYSLATKNTTLKYNPDGSLSLLVQADPPPEGQRSNWLLRPKATTSPCTSALIGRRRRSPTVHGRWRQCSG
jgi:hypothetical protein